MYWVVKVGAFALEHSEVAVVQVIQRLQTIETHVLSFSVIAPASNEMLSTGKSLIHARMKDNFVGSALSRAGDALIGGP